MENESMEISLVKPSKLSWDKIQFKLILRPDMTTERKCVKIVEN
jgi:hypothetical protein